MRDEEELEEALSRPSEDDVRTLGALEGDLLILGVSGKMGPSLARLAKRASDAAGVRRRVIGAARFSAPDARERLEAVGVETIVCDSLEPASVEALPESPNVVFMIGQKFGTASNPARTWAVNTLAPAAVCRRFPRSRVALLSSGNVYSLTPVDSGGPTEDDPAGPIGEYAQSALARERIIEYFSTGNGSPAVILRLNYAIDLRYGVLRDIADQVVAGRPIDLSMGYVNVIWQRDANSATLRALPLAATPPRVLNLTGRRVLAVRSLAEGLGQRLGKTPVFVGSEAPTALLSNASRCAELLNPETVSIDEMLDWTADWVRRGGAGLGKPTGFQERQGRF